MKYWIGIIVFSAFGTFAQVKNFYVHQRSDAAPEVYKNLGIKKCVVTQTVVKDTVETVFLRARYTYNEHGLCVFQKDFHNPNDSMYFDERHMVYDDNMRQKKVLHYSNYSGTSTYYNYLYNEAGQLIEIAYSSQRGTNGELKELGSSKLKWKGGKLVGLKDLFKNKYTYTQEDGVVVQRSKAGKKMAAFKNDLLIEEINKNYHTFFTYNDDRQADGAVTLNLRGDTVLTIKSLYEEGLIREMKMEYLMQDMIKIDRYEYFE